jgi:hypothetical protein
MTFEDVLKNAGWNEYKPHEYHKGYWRIVFDTSSWMEVGRVRSPRIFDVPIPETGMEQWTLNLINHLCKTDDDLQNLKISKSYEPGA